MLVIESGSAVPFAPVLMVNMISQTKIDYISRGGTSWPQRSMSQPNSRFYPPSAGLQDFGATATTPQQHQESPASHPSGSSSYGQVSLQNRASAMNSESDVFDPAPNLTASVGNNYDDFNPLHLDSPIASHFSGLSFGPVPGGGNAFQSMCCTSPTDYWYQRRTAPYYGGSNYGQYPPLFRPSTPFGNNQGAPDPPRLSALFPKNSQPVFPALFPPGGARYIRFIDTGFPWPEPHIASSLGLAPGGQEDRTQGMHYVPVTPLIDQRFTVFQDNDPIYGQDQTCAANLNDNPTSSFGAASGNSYDVPNPPHPVLPPSSYGAQYGSQATWRQSVYESADPVFGPLDRGNKCQDPSYASAAKQKYYPLPTPHHNRHRDSPSYGQYQSWQSQATPGARDTGIQPEQDERTHPSHAGDTIPTPNNKFRSKVGSHAGTGASSARRKKDARYKCGVEGCGAALTSQANLHYHRRAHKGEKPYSCETCGRPFYSSSDLRRHKGRQNPCQPMAISGASSLAS
ncbi:hypothetical protein PM082_013540 [Marasmius tenuissimus]|nr:hypothetical protein PM082_013540 [Marasmius tenuissimus]